MDIARFLLELGVLKRFKRTGWVRAGIQNSESIADHSFRTAFIAWLLAEEEHADTNKVVKMALLHDIEESRTGDHDMVMKMYNEANKDKAVEDMLTGLKIEEEADSLLKELKEKQTKEAIIVKDADLLDLYLQTVEYEVAGFTEGDKWKHNAEKNLQTDSAKALLEKFKKQEHTWWYEK